MEKKFVELPLLSHDIVTGMITIGEKLKTPMLRKI